ncbi:conserved hypothetical protein [Candidatus Roizmanbacteria bacterium]|nr:conserved hypothetical protein [Candidatus Roizmanbacteria bacterium]
MDKIIKLIDKTPIKAFGSSMEPFLYDGDLVYFEKVKTKQININDILLIKKGQFFIHRVIYKNDRYFITKGDHNLLSDGRIRPNQVLGKLNKIKRGGNFFKPEDIYSVQSSFYLKEIIRIKKLFEKNKVEYVILKGLPLHFFFEGTHPKRFYADCDILIDKEFFLQVEKILLSQGYKAVDFSLSQQHRSIRSKLSEHSYQKIIQGFPINFDIHLKAVFMMTQLGHLEALYPQKLIDQLSDEFIKTKKVVKINNEPFFILNSKFLILYLALHLFHHNFHGAFRYQFLDKVIRTDLDSRLRGNDKVSGWKIITQKITEYHLENFVYSVFLLLKKYYKTPLPRSFILTMKQWNNETMNRYSQINIFDSEPRILSGINRFRNLFFLSPNHLWRKILVFLNPEVIYALFFVLKKKLFYFLKAVLKNH